MSIILCVLGTLDSLKAQETKGTGSLAYFVGYHTAILELENGKKFCVSADSLQSWNDVMDNNKSSVDAKKPAKGIVAVLAKAFPCNDKSFSQTHFSANEIARAILGIKITADVAADKEFRRPYSLGILVAVADLGEGDSFCPDGNRDKLVDVLEAHQRRHPTASFSPAFVLDAFRAGYPCRH
jgi:hypothetical protein